MKRHMIAILMTLVLCVTGLMSLTEEVKAEVESEDIDMSYLLTDSTLFGYSNNQTWGIYLSSGYSIINKISSTKVGAGGVTNAALKCTVRVTSILERKTNTGSWARVTSWTQTNQNALSATISKSVTVSSGYYYRVSSHHYASSDTTYSGTDALWVN